MLLVSEAKAKGIIPEDYWDLVPEVCEGGCGEPLEITENLTNIRCTDNKCIHKLAGRGASMLQNLGIKGAGVSYCKRFIKTNGYRTHLGILIGTEKEHINTGHSVKGLKLRDTIQEIRHTRRFTFPSLVTLMSLPHLGTRAQDIFKGVNSYAEWLEKIEVTGVTTYQYVCNLPGFGTASAEKICGTLKEFETELNTITKIFKVKSEPVWTYNIAVTGPITELEYAFTREQFERYLNSEGKNLVAVRIGKSLKTCDYIVADGLDKENEYTYTTTSIAGMTREANGEEDILINSLQMVEKIRDDVNYLKECADKWYKERKTISEQS